jgi:hypothetical protein
MDVEFFGSCGQFVSRLDPFSRVEFFSGVELISEPIGV